MADKVKQVFISHATAADGEFAQRLAGDLRRLGVKVWIAPESIRTGESWVKAIERGLRESSHVVIVLTPAALESKWVEKETDVAIARERRGQIKIIPLSVEECEIPPLLDSYQMVFFRQGYEAGLSRLARDLGLSVAPAEPVPAPRQVTQSVPAPEVVSPTILERHELFEPEMILIPAGEFLMGSDPKKDKDTYEWEQPQHTLYLPDYYLAKTPVTNAQYAAFVEATGYRSPGHWENKQPPKGKEDHPVVYVTWHDAVDYCNWLAQVTGKAYRLPSEAEWEKGARGTDGRIYPWGNEWDPARCNAKRGGPGHTTPVGTYPQGASPYGLLDMVGNVWEWCHSLLKSYPYNPKDGREDPEASDNRVLRGGWFDASLRDVRCACSSWYLPFIRSYNLGFRICVAPGYASGLPGLSSRTG
jgi:formylglycine-generating enzyme required for sulfatase activity